MASGNASLVFEIYRNGDMIRSEEITQDVIKIGKLPSSHLRLEDPNVSRIHAVIERSKNGDVHIIDLGSSRGTMVNGERVNKCALRHGDEIILGQTRIVMRQPGMQVAAPAASLDAGWGDEATQVGLTAEALAAGAAQAGRAMPAAVQTPASEAASASVQVHMPAPGHPQAAQAQAQAPAGAHATGYDEQGNWHDGQGGWYDPEGKYFDGSGGWYDTDGNYFDGQGGWYDPEGAYHEDKQEIRVRDVDEYSDAFSQNYDDSGRGALEIAFLWMDHVLAVNQYKGRPTITIGENLKNTLQVKHPSIPDARFPLVNHQGANTTLNFTDQMSGMFFVGDQRYTMEEAIRGGLATQGGYGQGSYSLPLTPQTRARLDFGDNTILVHHAEPARGIPFGFNMDLGFMANLAASAVLHAIFMGVVFFVPPSADGFELDNFDLNNRFVTQLVKPEEPEEEEEPDWLKNKDEADEGAKHKGDEGKAGDKKSDQKNRKMAVKGPADTKEIQIQKDKEIVNNTGALAVLNNSPLTSAFGTGEQTLGMAAITAMGDNNGERTGNAFGIGAFGQVGTGRGGGGVSERGLGTGQGGIGTAGRGGGKGGGGGYGRNEGRIEERATRIPSVIPGRPVVTGSLDKEIIRRVIRKHRREIKYCYEQELIKNKNLAGKVVVEVTVASTGAVVAAVKRSSTLNNSKVERCMTSKIRRWIFPEPNGGGIVRVSYPFVFSSK